jgi:competence protein ComEA
MWFVEIRTMWYNMGPQQKFLTLCVVGIAIGSAGFWGYQKLSSPDQSWNPSITAIAGPNDKFPVHVAGAVAQPAVITGTREMLVQDAIEAAGGAIPEADLSRLNLAAKLLPNTRLYVPTKGDGTSNEELGVYGPLGGSVTGSAVGAASSLGGFIDINSADASELDKLPGVGPAIAQRIIEYRQANGPFRSVDDLIHVKGIGPKKMEQIRPMATVR